MHRKGHRMKHLRKTAAVLLALALVLALAACGKAPKNTANNNNNAAEPENVAPLPPGGNENDPTIDPDFGIEDPDDKKDPAAKDTLVVYFSATGNTKALAERIAKILGADIYEIVPQEPYTKEDLNYNDRSTRATVEQNDSAARPAIAGEEISLKPYTTIFLGYPIWWGEAPRILDTFVEQYSFGDIMIVPFCTSGSSSIGSSAKNLEKLANGGLWTGGARLDRNISDADLEAWVKGAL